MQQQINESIPFISLYFKLHFASHANPIQSPSSYTYPHAPQIFSSSFSDKSKSPQAVILFLLLLFLFLLLLPPE
jgi:hypothetical protein